MNKDILKGKWEQLKGTVREQWGKLTDDDVDVISGQKSQLVGKIQQRYGYAKERAEEEVENFLNSPRCQMCSETKSGNVSGNV